MTRSLCAGWGGALQSEPVQVGGVVELHPEPLQVGGIVGCVPEIVVLPELGDSVAVPG